MNLFSNLHWYKRLSIRYKILMIGFFGILCFGIYLFYNDIVIQGNVAHLHKLENQHLPVLRIADRNILLFEALRERYVSMVSSADQDFLVEIERVIARQRDNFTEMKKYNANIGADIDEISKSFEEYLVLSDKLAKTVLVDALEFKDREQVKSMISKGAEVARLMENFRSKAHSLFSKDVREIHESSEEALNVGLLIAVALLIAFKITTISISNSIYGSVRALNDALHALVNGDGNLLASLQVNEEDEIGTLKLLFNRFCNRVCTLTVDVVDACQSFLQKSNDITKMSEDAMVQIKNVKSEMSTMLGSQNEKLDEAISQIEKDAEQTFAEIRSLQESAYSLFEEAQNFEKGTRMDS